MPNQNLADLVTLKQTSEHIVLEILKTGQPAKQFALREIGKLPDGTSKFDVPKSEIYAYFARDLADGSVLTAMRRKEVPFTRRMKLYEAGIAAGLHVVEPEEGKQRGPKNAALTLENLTQAHVKSAKPAPDNDNL